MTSSDFDFSIEAMMREILLDSKPDSQKKQCASDRSIDSALPTSGSSAKSSSSSLGTTWSSSVLPPPIDNKRDYQEIMRENMPKFTFGSEGAGNGQFSRPWGICCDKLGRIIIADRSNNRVQIFNAEGGYLMKFGTYGQKMGQMNRPAGVTVNSLNQIIVCDKDNHRVQVFGEYGKFMFAFGNHGRQSGYFNYPWGVACNSKDDIAISDTRNHRIQIFSKTGQFLRKCSFDVGFLGKNAYSPRGLVFMPGDRLIVTDFNGHRIGILDVTKKVIEVAFYGTEGIEPGLFCRPQGICLDNENNLIVADSRSNRIQAFDLQTMRVLGIFGSYQGMDRPTDVCVGKDGRIYVIDFGNNCVRVF
jgi:tripartite motif-containing protein 71